MKTFVYPGTFDPFTLGHLDIAGRAAKLCDRLVVAVSTDRASCMFTADKRAEMSRAALKGIGGCEVVSFSGLLPVFARSVNAQCIVRGLRSVADFEFESSLSVNYKLMAPEIENILLFTDVCYSYISASVVRDIIKYNGDIGAYVPAEIIKLIKKI